MRNSHLPDRVMFVVLYKLCTTKLLIVVAMPWIGKCLLNWNAPLRIVTGPELRSSFLAVLAIILIVARKANLLRAKTRCLVSNI
jgi:hypothetical protein